MNFGTTFLTLRPIEIVPQDAIQKVRLGNFVSVRGALDQFLIIVCNDKGLVFIRECPRANVAIKIASPASIAFYIVALLAQRLPVAQIVGSTSGPRTFVVRAKLDIRLLRPARCAFVAVSLFEFFPVGITQFSPGLLLLTQVQTLKLVAGSFLSDGSETFLALQLAYTTENIFVRTKPFVETKRIDGRTNVVLTEQRTGNAMSCRPQRSQNNSVVPSVCRTRSNEASLSVCEPFFSILLRFVRSRSRGEQESFTSARFSHFGMEF